MMKKYEVRKPIASCESGLIIDRLELTLEQKEEVEAVLRKHPGLFLVEVKPATFRRLTGEYTIP